MTTYDKIARLRALTEAESRDEALILICEAHPDLLDAFNKGDEDSHDQGAAWQAYAASCDAITATKPATLAGIVAKALAAKAEAQRPDGSEVPDGTMGAVWAWDLVSDLCRLHEIGEF